MVNKIAWSPHHYNNIGTEEHSLVGIAVIFSQLMNDKNIDSNQNPSCFKELVYLKCQMTYNCSQ